MTRARSMAQPPELWAGVECTVNRVGDRYLDQLELSGHELRIKDLERLAELGVRTLRYPILWERTAPKLLRLDWSWADTRLACLKRLHVSPIVGLLHHGSGPSYTNLLDPEFPKKLALFAGAVARRYPWVKRYTPVNEPLTTARFSCLYGHWYPHQRDALLFARALLSQCRGTVLSMRAIQEVNSEARVIPTEDLAKTFSTPVLQYQAEFENERRWLTFDLICGRLTSESPMWKYFRWLGVDDSELEWFIDNQVEPEMLGVNHYITSERFLDERTMRYPAHLHGGNGRHLYADVEAVRVCASGVAGLRVLLKEAWERYHLPLAVTEAHLGCSREEQLRWLSEVWNAALSVQSESVDVRAVTAWAAFGAYGWNNLLTSDDNSYEPGLFDLRSPFPRPTALSKMVQSLAANTEFDHPVLDGPGWWHRLDRFCYPPVTHHDHGALSSLDTAKTGSSGRCLVITGATGTLGQAFARICEGRGLAYQLLRRNQLDIAEPESVARALDRYEPWAVINAAGYARVDDAERQREMCMRENVAGPHALAKHCAANKLPLVTFSSDMVFDGKKMNFYVEGDECSPVNAYGESKAQAELRVLDAFPEALIIRTSEFFGPWDPFNFVHSILEKLRKHERVFAANDITVSPTYVPDLVNAVLDLLIDGETGIWHLANDGKGTWAEFARRIADKAGYNSHLVNSRGSGELGFTARRPSFSALSSERGSFLPTFDEGLEKCLRAKQWRANRSAGTA
jgi:dTDP-4-dehydrorhamnose reductase